MTMPDRIEIDIPEWAKDNNIYIMAGMNLLAYRFRGGPLMVKTEFCSMCGKCCSNINGKHPFLTVDGRCTYLVKEVGDNDRWLCGLGGFRPHGCAVTTPDAEYCTVRFEEVVE